MSDGGRWTNMQMSRKASEMKIYLDDKTDSEKILIEIEPVFFWLLNESHRVYLSNWQPRAPAGTVLLKKFFASVFADFPRAVIFELSTKKKLFEHSVMHVATE